MKIEATLKNRHGSGISRGSVWKGQYISANSIQPHTPIQNDDCNTSRSCSTLASPQGLWELIGSRWAKHPLLGLEGKFNLSLGDGDTVYNRSYSERPNKLHVCGMKNLENMQWSINSDILLIV